MNYFAINTKYISFAIILICSMHLLFLAHNPRKNIDYIKNKLFWLMLKNIILSTIITINFISIYYIDNMRLFLIGVIMYIFYLILASITYMINVTNKDNEELIID